jgi:hypothetical protein
MIDEPRPFARQLRDGDTSAGSVNRVTRRGEQIVRPAGHWTPAIHHLLEHLHRANFAGAPRVVGFDGDGREILTYIHGEVALRPWPPCLLAESGLLSICRWLRDYHIAVRDYIPPAEAKWRDPHARWRPGLIVRHGDLGPWNTVWHGGDLAGVIDWDLAEPGHWIEDFAQLAWSTVPLRPPSSCAHAGVALGDQRPRFLLLCEACQVPPRQLLDALLELHEREIARTQALGASAVEPWATFLGRGDARQLAADREWLSEWSLTAL